METSQGIELEEITTIISCHTLADISNPQTLKIKEHIKRKGVELLINSGSIHKLFNYKLERILNFLLCPTPKFHVMIGDGGTINCSRKCNKIKLNMGEYLLVSPMISIQMGGVDVVLEVQWL